MSGESRQKPNFPESARVTNADGEKVQWPDPDTDPRCAEFLRLKKQFGLGSAEVEQFVIQNQDDPAFFQWARGMQYFGEPDMPAGYC